MKNLTNQILVLEDGKNYFVVRQASYKGVTYYFGAEVNEKEDDFTNEFCFLERVEEGDKFYVKKVTDPEIIEVLAKNIKLDN